jgi:hypothetical protein
VRDIICEPGVPGGALNLDSTGYPDYGRYGNLPLQGKISTAEPGLDYTASETTSRAKASTDTPLPLAI